jgi:hypothetical protein
MWPEQSQQNYDVQADVSSHIRYLLHAVSLAITMLSCSKAGAANRDEGSENISRTLKDARGPIGASKM